MKLPGWFPTFGSTVKKINSGDVRNQNLVYPDDFKLSTQRLPSMHTMHPFWDDFRIIFYGLFIVGRFPFIRDSKGEVKHSLFSYAGVYWLAAYSLQTTVAFTILSKTFFVIFGNSKYDEALGHARNALFLFALLVSPISCIREWNVLANHINKCNGVLVNFRITTGCDLIFGMEKLCLSVLTIVTPPICLMVSYVDQSFQIESIYERLLYVSLFVGFSYVCFIWTLFHVIAQRLADYVCLELRKIKEKSTKKQTITPVEVHVLRSLWIQATSLLEDCSQSMGLTLFFSILVGSACFVISAYGCVSAIFNQDFQLLANQAMTLGGTIVYLMIALEAGYRSTEKIMEQTITQVSLIDITSLNELASREVNMFFQTLAVKRPTVTCAGYITANRSFVGTLLSSTVTYLIVLIQFRNINIDFAHSNETAISDLNE